MSVALAVELAARSGEGWKSGPLGLLVILLLCVACYFLFKSMSKHLKRVREEFPEPAAPAPSAKGAADSPRPSVDLVKRADVVKRDVTAAGDASQPVDGPPSA